MKRFKPLELFAINEELNIQKVKLADDSLILIIDNFYKKPDNIKDLILSSPVPIWKHTPDTLNFKQYYDCRHSMSFFDEPPFVYVINSIVSHYYDFTLVDKTYPFISNCFQWIEDQPVNAVGNRVHTDGLNTVAASIFFNTNEECNGGTGIYRSKYANDIRLVDEDNELEDHVIGTEAFMPAEDGSVYYHDDWDRYWALEEVIPMAYNRCILYPGYLFHAAYHTDNAFKDYPRIAQVCFLESEFEVELKPQDD